MEKRRKRRVFFLSASLAYVGVLFFFYIKYVPLIKSFQLILLPVLLLTLILTAYNIRWGIIGFVFLFPVINSLPYFFNIFENIPHSPVALVLFLFFFLGWLIHNFLFDSEPFLRLPIFKPVLFFSLLVCLSAVITIFRYANFFPFLSDRIYELSTNIHGVTSGGAIMSSVFNSLNYLTAFAFFFILINTMKSKKFVRNLLVTLLLSTMVSLIIGFFQHFYEPSFGNTPLMINHNIINATFKDANSFGVFLSAVIPLFLGMTLAFKKIVKVAIAVTVLGSFLILPYTGSLSGLLGISVSLIVFFLLLLKVALDVKRTHPRTFWKIVTGTSILLILTTVVVTSTIIPKDSNLFKKMRNRISYLEKRGDWDYFTSSRLSYFWEMATEMTIDYPFSGVGIGSYIIELPNYSELHQKAVTKADSAENYFLQVSSELGILGLLLSLWIFWEIIKQVIKNYKFNKRDNVWKFISIGLTAGIVSFFINLQVHTYIGSFEIKYAFWLLIAFLFYSGNWETKQAEARIYQKYQKVVGIVCLILFGGIHLWNSTHTLSLKNRTEELKLSHSFGLSKQEKTPEGREFNWTNRYGGITTVVQAPLVEIPILASHPDIQKNPVIVKIFLVKDLFKEKRLLDELTMDTSEWIVHHLFIPEEVGNSVMLLFNVSRTWNPQKTLGTPDPRDLGVAIGKIRFKEK
jgi:hypothetical protein